MTVLTVGKGQQYATIAAAVAMARDGDTVSVLAGTYTNDFATIRTNITLIASGGPVVLTATNLLPPGGALLKVAANAIVDGLVFAGAQAADGTAAGLLQTAGTLTVRNALFTGNQTGLLSTASGTATLTVQRSEFAANGNGTAFSANIWVGGLQSLTITDSYIHDASGGDEVRSIAHATTITNTRIEDNTAASATVLNVPNGGNVSIQNSVLQKGARSSTVALVRLGGGTQYPVQSLSLGGNTLVTDRPGAVLVQNTTTTAATINGNQLFGFTGPNVTTGLVVLSGNTVVTSRPAVPTAAIVTYATGIPTQYGRTGAVVANGTILHVGDGNTYATLAAALAVAKDGDTIAVSAGTYPVSPLTVTHKLVLEGVGGIARFIATPTPAAALFTTNADVTFQNIEISNAGSGSSTEAAINATSGAITIVNSYIHDNANGIVASGKSTTLGIYDTELAYNGTPDGFGANIATAAIDTLTLAKTYVHDALAGPEVSSAAAYTVIDTTRIGQLTGNGAADLLLPSGGTVTITNSAFEKSATAEPGPLIQVGGGGVTPGSTITITGTTLISDIVTSPTVFVSGDPAAVTTLNGDTFVGGTPGSTQAVNATVSAPVLKSGIAVATTSPWTGSVSATGVAVPQPVPSTIAAAAPAVAERGVLILDISGSAYRGDAQFQLLVDGTALDATLTAIASHAAGQSQTFVIAGTFAPGPHTVAVKFVNALSDGTGTAGRTLSIDGAQFNGVPFGQPTMLAANGTATFSTTPVPTLATNVAVSISEDAWHGDAQALVTIDGKISDGVQVVTAAHALGGTEPFKFLPMLSPGTHTLGITVLNGADSQASARNLYIDAIDVAGQHIVPTTRLLKEGTANFAFNVTALPSGSNGSLFIHAGTPQAASVILPTP